MLRGFFTVGAWTMASRVLGLVRDQILAATMGVGAVADAFYVAFRLPNLFRRLFGEGAFNAAFVPLFTGLLATEGPAVARGFAEEAMAVLSFWLLLLTVAGEIFMPAVLHVIAPGFAGDPHKFALAVTLSRITFPYMLLICVAALVSGVLNGLDRFGAASAAYVMFNVVGIAAILGLTPYVATVGHAAAWGITASGVAQLALLLWAVKRAGMALRLPRPRLTPQMRLLMRRMAPGLIGSGIVQLNLAVDTIISTLLPAGSVALLYLADRVNQLPLGVLGNAAGTSLLPALTREAKTDPERALATHNRAVGGTLLLTIPACVALLVLARPIMEVLFGRGAFTAHDAALSAQSLACYAVGLPAFVMVKLLGPGFYARGDTSTPVRLGLATLAVNLALNLALMRPLAHMGPPLATSLASTLNTGLLGVVLWRRGWFRPDRALMSRVARTLVATLVMALVLEGLLRGLPTVLVHGHGWRACVGLGGMMAAGLAAFGAAAQALGLIRLGDVGRRVRGRLWRGREGRAEAG
jgi:putative peptidoglycan lipid II flippase